jgi:hypothetical protein
LRLLFNVKGVFIWLTSDEMRCRFAAMAAVLRIVR